MFISELGYFGGMPVDWVVTALRAAGEPTRLRILALLARGELAVGELAQALGQSQPRVSRHLKLLAEAELIERTPEGAWVFYRLARERGRLFAETLLRFADPGDQTFTLDAERLSDIRAAREAAAADYFARNAGDWDRLRRLHLPERDIEAAILDAAGPGPFELMVDAGVGAGRMIELFAPRVKRAEGFDVSRHMLAAARAVVDKLPQAGVQYGDIYAPPVSPRSADLVMVHHVLHYLADPRRAVIEAARMLRPGGRLLIVDFAPHALEFLRAQHEHRRLGFSDAEIETWCAAAGVPRVSVTTLAPAVSNTDQLTVKIWAGDKAQVSAVPEKAA